MEKINITSRELTRAERTAIRKLVNRWCANYDHEYGCLILDGPCYMLGKWWSGAYCKYFERALLPLDLKLEAALSNISPAVRHCVICGQSVYATGNRTLYCKNCAKAARRKRQRNYQQQYRRKSRSYQ